MPDQAGLTFAFKADWRTHRKLADRQCDAKAGIKISRMA